MTPEMAQLPTNNSSIQGSPDGIRGREPEMFPMPFELPESIVPASSAPSRKSSHGAMSEALAIRESRSPGIMRRLSNRASRLTGRRRQSSTAAMNRDQSTGPVIMRRRSDSTNTAPEGINGKGWFPDTDSEVEEDCEDSQSGSTVERLNDFPSTTSSVTPTVASSAPSPGPVIPALLLQGTSMVKVTKKKKKLLTFVLEHEAAKVSWDKTRASKSFYIDDIKDIRVGADATIYRKEFGISDADESRFFSIIYAVPDKFKGRPSKIMHLIASDEQSFDLWTTTLDAISKHRQDFMQSLTAFHDKAVKAYWRIEMAKQFQDAPHNEEDEDIDIVGVERVCRSLHIHGSSNYFRSKFAQADTTKCGRLNFAEFQEFIKLMKRRDDVASLYQLLTKDSSKGLTLEQFLAFLRDVQGEDIVNDRSHWEGVFNKFVRRSKTKEQARQDEANGGILRMNEAALSRFLSSTFNVPLRGPSKDSLHRPMNEYIISSSHNTYLLGRQVAGQSSVEAYISALNRGCRCVEVDCWDGGDGQPVVMHGRTLTTQVSFVDVMSTISKYAFVRSQYPLWISLEVHCNPEQQAAMAQIIKDTCGVKLLTELIDNNTEHLPSPSQLMNKILIKVKMAQAVASPVAEQTNGRSRGNSLNSPYFRPTILDNGSISASLPQSSPYTRRARTIPLGQTRNSGSDGQESSSTSESESVADESKKASTTSNIVKVLGELGLYSAGIKFRGFDASNAKKYNHIFSFMEGTFDRNGRTPESKRAMTRHNMKFMMRVYPNATRIASTNFDPLKYWRRGVQMVALNWQTYDLGMQMNDAMFAGGCDQSGYVLKPRELREIQMMTEVPKEAGEGYTKRERKNVNFSITVISAQQLMRPQALAANRSVDPYVEVEVYHADDKSKENKGVVGVGGKDASGKDGLSGLGAPHRRRTDVVKENGFNPLFEKKFNFDLTTKYPDLVFVRWTVRCSPDGTNYSDKGVPLATYTAKLSSLQQGYRTLPLLDNNGDRFLFSTLFCHIKIDPATSIYVNGPEATESLGVFKSIGRTIFNRTPTSPRILSENYTS
ncbi:putative 1-phosphatidylinositol-4,5-bisphosphate phosphodiesterase 1 [Calycina marina]|uniref:Phosphoinositide phospholipase C n=1 Tax=Calycina marina TaxID=1763456 RepID=A0A9P8CCI2_9HELO|nr:putative 1-phosphatidylinositol-4,5-bisphosphate phosphodiesterase 1 [Calycina marina]